MDEPTEPQAQPPEDGYPERYWLIKSKWGLLPQSTKPTKSEGIEYVRASLPRAAADDDADILDDERVDKELRRWQDAIRDKMIDMGVPDHLIDGAGCDRHHPDYNKPLDVITVCQPCHEKVHHGYQ